MSDWPRRVTGHRSAATFINSPTHFQNWKNTSQLTWKLSLPNHAARTWPKFFPSSVELHRCGTVHPGRDTCIPSTAILGRSNKMWSKVGEITFDANFLRIDVEVKSLLPAARQLCPPFMPRRSLHPLLNAICVASSELTGRDESLQSRVLSPTCAYISAIYLRATKSVFTLHSGLVTNERDTCSAFVFTKGFSTYGGGGREIGGGREGGRKEKIK